MGGMKYALRAIGLALSVLALGGCNQKQGKVALPVDPAKLRAECEALANQGEKTWTSSDPLPATVKSLAPQIVEVRKTEQPPATVVDIQVTGGFQHHGYIVIVTNNGPEFVPRVGRDWHVTEVAPRVFQYTE